MPNSDFPSSDFDVVTGPPVPSRPLPPANPGRAPTESVPQVQPPALPAAPSDPPAGRR
jgi:hypothetical protein